MEPIYLANMSDSELQILLDDVQNEIHKREEIMCITALNRLGRTIKEVQESNFDISLTLASGEVIKVNDIINTFSYAFGKTYYIDEKELERISRFPQPKEEIKSDEDGTITCIHAYDDVDCHHCVNRYKCWSED
jgi:hypothetical protein